MNWFLAGHVIWWWLARYPIARSWRAFKRTLQLGRRTLTGCEPKLTCVQSQVGSELTRLNERFVATRVGASVGPFACMGSEMSLEGLFAREGALAESAPDGAL